MKRFIFVSFAFLAFAFYQMSGGSDFKPRVAAIPHASAIDVTRAESAGKPDQVQAASLIASPAITPTSVKPAPVAFVTPAKSVGLPAIATAALADQASPALPNANPIAQPLVLASLEQGLSGLTSAAPVRPTPEPAAFTQPTDIREITATRVNMRDGPGTTFPVLTRLSLGDEVEILDVPGNGWLRLRTLPEQRIGWISASLVSKASR